MQLSIQEFHNFGKLTYLVGFDVPRLVHNTVGTFPELVHAFISEVALIRDPGVLALVMLGLPALLAVTRGLPSLLPTARGLLQVVHLLLHVLILLLHTFYSL